MADNSEKIIIQYQADISGLKADMKVMQEEMKKLQNAGTDAAKSTEDAFSKTETATKSLRTQLKELKAALATATDPKDVERLAKAAGEVKNKLDDAAKAAQIFASDSKFEQVGTALRGIAGNLLSLNFKQAADQSKLLAAASKQITFKEALVGVKDLGTTLFNIGKSLLSNPLFLLGSAITLIISNFDKLTKAGGAIGGFFKGISTLIDNVTSGITAMSDAIGLTNTTAAAFAESQKKNAEETKKYIDDVTEQIIKNNNAAMIALGRLTEAEATRKASRDKFNKDFKDEFIKQQQEIAKLREQFDKTTETLTGENAISRKNRELQLNADIEKVKEAHLVRLNKITELYQSEETLSRANEIKKQKEQDEKAAKERADALQKELDALKLKNQQFIDSIFLYRRSGATKQDELDKKTEDRLKKSQDKITENFKNSQEQQKIIAEEYAKKLAKIEEDKANVAKESWNLFYQSLDTLKEINSRKLDEQLNENKDRRESDDADLEAQLKRREISQEQYEQRLAANKKKADDRDRELKRKAFERDKSISLIEAAINTAQAVTKALSSAAYPYSLVLAALAAASGAEQIALINSQPAPKFEKGGKVKGQRHYAGGTLIEAEKDEWIINRTQSIKHDKLLESINKGKVESYIQEIYIAPILKKTAQVLNEQKGKEFASNIANSLMLNSGFKDSNLLDSLKQSRKNDREIAHYIVSSLKQSSYNARKN